MSKLGRFWDSLWQQRRSWRRGRRRPPITYPTIFFAESAPQNSEIRPGTVTIVAPKKQPKWALFLCPNGCGAVITLSLQLAHKPHWTVYKSNEGRPTLRPSVWRDVGCLSHFILEDGRIYWCGNTGISPNAVRRYDDFPFEE